MLPAFFRAAAVVVGFVQKNKPYGFICGVPQVRGMGTVGKAAQAGLHNRALVVLVVWVRSHSQVEKQTVCKVCTFTPLRGVLCLGKGPPPRCIPARGFAPLRVAHSPQDISNRVTRGDQE